ncbi:uncharacterized protein LOC110856399 [Folsomia candida]|uniref:Uncharacterized protein n=1 Tax=Folsomia candida TaxID=158441 RepID=A0A226DMX7_FOLCA|nr:uncharacterized protein LOC110856399 [Folsomia candida]OXA46539.1 hypothetical protein Fcan01_18829 [Folsomia candida]
MAHAGVLSVLELVAIVSCGYGLFALSSGIHLFGSLGLAYGSLWFLLGATSNICGLVGLYLMMYGPVEQAARGSQPWIQYHYLLAWLTIVLGYPTFLTMIWLAHYPSPYDQLNLVLALLPLLAWAKRRTKTIVLTTQIVSGIAILSHIWICVVASQIYGLIGAGIMIINVTALSIPTKYNLWGFSSREMYVIGLSITSAIFAQEVSTMVKGGVVHVSDVFKVPAF